MKTALFSASALVAIATGAAAHADPELGAATLPGARSGVVGDTLTVFAAITNSGNLAGTDCAPQLVSNFQGSFAYRAVEANNASFTAPENTPVPIAAGATQNYILALTASASASEQLLEFRFDCSNSSPAPIISGVNTVLLTASPLAGPDILPIMVTASGDGVIRIPGLARAAAAAVAATNISSAGGEASVVVSADMGDLLGEPLTLGICETGSDGQCVDESGAPAQTPAPAGQDSIRATIGTDISTFSVFAYADQNIGVRLNPDLSRVHVRFHDLNTPAVAAEELASISLAPRPEGAGLLRADTSAAPTVPGRPPIPEEDLPVGIYEAVFSNDGARGEGLILAGTEGDIALWFDAGQLATPFDNASAAFIGTALPVNGEQRFTAEGRAHDLDGGDDPDGYRLRANWGPLSHIEGRLEPLTGNDGDAFLVRAQYDGLYSRTVTEAGLDGRHQFLINGRPLGEVSFDAGAFTGTFSDGGDTAANCALTGQFTHAEPATPRNLFAVSATAATADGQADCAVAGSVTGLGLEFDAPRDDAVGAVTQAMLVAITESTNQSRASVLGFRPVSAAGFNVTRIASGMSQALFLTGLPGAPNTSLVVRQSGRIEVVDTVSGAVRADPFLDISGDILVEGERGLLGLALAPDFITSGAFYVNITNPAGDTEIRRYTTQDDDRTRADTASADIILTQAQPGATHNGGWLGFGPDGYLYAAFGDGGGPDPSVAQDMSSLLGSIVRIDVSADDFPADANRDYAIPSGNPFASGGGAPEIWAKGLRNPFRNSFDPLTGDLVIADVGNSVIEEIDIIPAGEGGLNFGWPVREGSQALQGPDDPAFTGPVAEYRHGSGPRQGNSITGGYVYRGEIDALDGQYIFGDFVSANVWSLYVEDFDNDALIPAAGFIVRNDDFAPDTGTISNIASFGTGNDGQLHIVDYDGEIFRVEAEPAQ